MNAMTTRTMFRANYVDLNTRNGEARANVFADITLPALAPVLRNPLLQGPSKNRSFQLNIGSGALQFPFVLIS